MEADEVLAIPDAEKRLIGLLLLREFPCHHPQIDWSLSFGSSKLVKRDHFMVREGGGLVR